MKHSFFNRHFGIALLIALALAFVYASYSVIDNIVAEQSRVQQQALSPVYKLVHEELLRPLHIAETFASSVALDSADFDEAALLRQLGKMEKDLELVFFVASELRRKQYFSNGRTLNLIEGEVAWYFEAKAQEQDFMADLGQVGDVHLFFDVKVHGVNDEFLGYVGVGKRIQRFLDTFDQYKSRFGYDFLFVNEKEEIILSSLPELVVTDAYIPTLESVYDFRRGQASDQSYDSEIVKIEDGDFLISEFRIEELKWRLLLLVPLESRQAQITRTFLTKAVVAVFFVLLFAGTLLFLMLLYKRRIEERAEIDILTGLPNRTYVQRRFNQHSAANEELCAVIIDLDHFKAINDDHGHDAGDRVLEAAARVFRSALREEDIVSRWGGEEFVMLIPAESVEIGKAIAQRARENLEDLVIETPADAATVTASFGIAFGNAGNESLDQILARADEALYAAKQSGRNQVRVSRAQAQ